MDTIRSVICLLYCTTTNTFLTMDEIDKIIDETLSESDRDLIYFNEVCKDIFKAENPMTLIEKAEGLFSDISDKRTRRSSSAVFNTLFDVEDMGDDNDSDTFEQQDDEKMKELNDSIL